MSSIASRHFSSGDYNFVAGYGNPRQKIPVQKQDNYSRKINPNFSGSKPPSKEVLKIHTRQENYEALAGRTKNIQINQAAKSNMQLTISTNMQAHHRPEKEPASTQTSQWTSEATGTKISYKTRSLINYPSQQVTQCVLAPMQSLHNKAHTKKQRSILQASYITIPV